MAVKPHPSMLLVLDIDEELDTKEQRLEIDRCYSYIGTPVVRTHTRAASDDEPCNIVRLIVRLGTKRYWQRGEEADALWNDVLKSWLFNQFYKLDNHLKIYNRRQREENTPELNFTWLEVDLENGAFTVRFRLDSTSGIPAEESAWLTAVRETVGTGSLGEGVTQVTLPSETSYAEQREAGLAAKAERERQEAEERERQHAEREAEARQREAEASEMFLESPALAAKAAEESDDDLLDDGMLLQGSGLGLSDEADEGKPADDSEKTAEEIIAERIAEEEHLAEELERKYALPDPDFTLDYGIWTVHYGDGATRDYRFADKAFVA